MKELMIAIVKRSTVEEIAQLLCDLTEEAATLRKDAARLDCLRHLVSGKEFRRIGICMDNSGDLDELRQRIDDILETPLEEAEEFVLEIINSQ